ncbi:GWxTD domain-containing protein [candidate division KSB1 bacterium]|nr:GWxTD domain-containing protein [candidate division KSB1 bacterium]
MFSVFWGNVPMAKSNLEIAVDQLSLVAHKRDIEAVRNASEAERKIIYDEFWLKRDPTPNTNSNELKDEFFGRIDFSNRNFGEIAAGRSGWQTDRGKIYIVYGAPDNVDRRDAGMNTPATEVWHYNRLNRKYFFADRDGEGAFRLVKIE